MKVFFKYILNNIHMGNFFSFGYEEKKHNSKKNNSQRTNNSSELTYKPLNNKKRFINTQNNYSSKSSKLQKTNNRLNNASFTNIPLNNNSQLIKKNSQLTKTRNNNSQLIKKNSQLTKTRNNNSQLTKTRNNNSQLTKTSLNTKKNNYIVSIDKYIYILCILSRLSYEPPTLFLNLLSEILFNDSNFFKFNEKIDTKYILNKSKEINISISKLDEMYANKSKVTKQNIKNDSSLRIGVNKKLYDPSLLNIETFQNSTGESNYILFYITTSDDLNCYIIKSGKKCL